MQHFCFIMDVLQTKPKRKKKPNRREEKNLTADEMAPTNTLHTDEHTLTFALGTHMQDKQDRQETLTDEAFLNQYIQVFVYVMIKYYVAHNSFRNG